MPYCSTYSNMNWCCGLQRLRKCWFVWNLSATAWQSSVSAVSVSLADKMDRIGSSFCEQVEFSNLMDCMNGVKRCQETCEIGNGFWIRSIACRELFSNNISGPIPSELGNLSQLVSLDLYVNDFTGDIPSTLGQLANLRFLWVSSTSWDSFGNFAVQIYSRKWQILNGVVMKVLCLLTQ
jgi:hypothetical protein